VWSRSRCFQGDGAETPYIEEPEKVMGQDGQMDRLPVLPRCIASDAARFMNMTASGSGARDRQQEMKGYRNET